MKFMNKQGYTLVELLITIAIVGILAGVAITSYVGVTRKAARSEAYSNLEALRLLEEQFFAENGNYTADLGGAGSTDGVRNANVAAIQAVLPNFRPGNAANFSYRVIADTEITTVDIPFDALAHTGARTPCFVAVGTGIDDTKVDGDIFAIDCNNNRNF